ncbi:hypothetical protein FOZ62_015452 [Perkinsus olseni]|uniref:Uncharacterized protein n=1 Tax=Perkinsus olseni TaxID=32597 RepID=A0A7J6TIB0_PEROL|nr:hypothetical protein FOZ62_015452 [Perkinsus olseni]
MEYEVYFGCNLVGTIAVVLIFFYTYYWSNTVVRMWSDAVLEELQRQQQCYTLFFKERRRVGLEDDHHELLQDRLHLPRKKLVPHPPPRNLYRISRGHGRAGLEKAPTTDQSTPPVTDESFWLKRAAEIVQHASYSDYVAGSSLTEIARSGTQESHLARQESPEDATEGLIDPECPKALLSPKDGEASTRAKHSICDDSASSGHEHPLSSIPETLHVYDEEGQLLFPKLEDNADEYAPQAIPSGPDQPVYLRSALNRLLRMRIPDHLLMEDEVPSPRNHPRIEPTSNGSRPDVLEPQDRGFGKIARGSRAFEAIDTCWTEFIREYQSQCEAQSSSEARQLMASNLEFITELRSRVRESWAMVAEASLPIDSTSGGVGP